MAIKVRRIEGEELPAMYRSRGIKHAFEVTGAKGQVFYLDTDEDAAALAAKLHREDVDDVPDGKVPRHSGAVMAGLGTPFNPKLVSILRIANAGFGPLRSG